MAKTTAQQWLDRWGAGLNNNTQRIADGVRRVTTAPGQAAAAKKDKMRAGILAAIDSGKWATSVAAISLPQWQDSMVTKGVNNIASGVTQAKKTKVQAIQNMLDDNDAAVAAIQNMPSDTAEQRMQRAMAFMQMRRQIAQQKGQ